MLKNLFNFPDLNNNSLNNSFFKKIITILTFSIIFVIGIISVNDFGTTNDEYSNRFRSLVTINHVGDKFFPNINKKFKGDKEVPKLSEVSDKMKFYGGSIVQVPLTLLEILSGTKDKKSAFILRHYVYFLIFFFSLIAFYNILKIRFFEWQYCIIGTLILFLTPRVFSFSIYSNFDIPLMAFTIYAVNYGLKIIKKTTFKRIIIFSFFAAAASNIRIMGLIIPAFICFTIFTTSISDKQKIKESILNIIKISFLTFFIYILIFPSLWGNPLINTFKVFTNLGNHSMSGLHLYLGNLIGFTDKPWHYVPVWIFITLPIFYSLFFILGLFDFIRDFFKNKKTLTFHLDIFFSLMIITPIIAVIILNSTLYDGWRHLYFIYPFLVIFMIKGLISIPKIFNNSFKFEKLLKIFILMVLLDNSIWMIKNHPHQYVFFNKFIRNEASKNFELDYFTASYKTNYDFLIKNEKKDEYLIADNGNRVKLFYSLFSLNDLERKKFKVVEKSKAEYLITSYNLDYQNYDKKFFEKYKLLNEVIIDGNKINSLFKLK